MQQPGIVSIWNIPAIPDQLAHYKLQPESEYAI